MGIDKNKRHAPSDASGSVVSCQPHRFGPLIISTSMHHGDGLRDYSNKMPCYSLWGLHSGELTLWDQDGVPCTHSGPINLLLTPSGCTRVVCPAASEVMSLQFDILERAFLHDIYGVSSWPKGQRVRQVQPEPEAIWGMSLPRVLPARIYEETRAVIRDCCATAWRGMLHYLRANMRLGLWLTDLALAESVRGEEPAPAPADPAGDSPESEWALRIVERARRQLDAGVRVADMATWARMSPRHFSRRFLEQWGVKPGRFLLEERLLQASRLLRSSNRSIAQIAKDCGYKSPKSFSLKFRSFFGVSPRHYRISYPA